MNDDTHGSGASLCSYLTSAAKATAAGTTISGRSLELSPTLVDRAAAPFGILGEVPALLGVPG